MDYQSLEYLRWEDDGGSVGIDQGILTERIIFKRMVDYAVARNRHDVKAMTMFFSEDADLIGTTGRILSGRAAIEQNFLREYETVYADSYAIRQTNEIRLIDNDVAITTGRFQVEEALSEEGQALPNFRGLFTVIWKRVGNNWLIAAYRSMVPVNIFSQKKFLV